MSFTIEAYETENGKKPAAEDDMADWFENYLAEQMKGTEMLL